MKILDVYNIFHCIPEKGLRQLKHFTTVCVPLFVMNNEKLTVTLGEGGPQNVGNYKTILCDLLLGIAL